MVNREEPETVPSLNRNLVLILVVAGAGALLMCLVCSGVVGGLSWWWKSGSKGRLEKQVAEMIEKREDTKIKKVSLIKKSDTQYTGIVYAEDGREGSVEVTTDGDSFVAEWRLRKR